MTMIMIYHIRSKYTAVGKVFFFFGFFSRNKTNFFLIGRQEIVMFFYLYMLSTLLDMLLVTAIIPTSSAVYPVSVYLNQTQKERKTKNITI